MAGAKKKATNKTIKPGKDIIASMSDDFRKKLLKVVNGGIRELTIDLTGVNMVDSVGLGVIIATHNSLDDLGGSLKLKNVSEDIYRLIRTMRLDQHFEVIKAS